MHGYEYDLACGRLDELRAQADTAARLRRLRAARRWARRAEYARLRAARASAAVRGRGAASRRGGGPLRTVRGRPRTAR